MAASALGILLPSLAHAVYIYGQVLQKDDIKVVLLGDLHLDEIDGIRTVKQMDDLAHEAKKHNAHVHVEDGVSCKGMNREISEASKIRHAYYRINEPVLHNRFEIVSPMWHFYDFCLKNNISATNCEFRNDKTSEMNTFYKVINFKPLENNVEFQNYIGRNISINELFDCNMLCDLIKNINKKKQKIFVLCAGGNHITNISNMLQKMLHFKQVMTTSRIQVTGTQIRYAQGVTEILDSAVDIPELFSHISRTPEIMSKL
jgi:hypothetical protein